MNRAKNIAKLIMMLTTILLLAVPRYAHAQNTGKQPYIESEHAYEVKFGKVGNEKHWVLTNNEDELDNAEADDPPTYTYTFINGVGNGNWFTFPEDASTGHQRVNIYFDRDVFAPNDAIIEEWRLRYYEFEDIHGDGSKVCISAREFIINITENTFYFTLGEDKSVCNSQSGKVHSYEAIYTELFATEVSYTVTMHKDEDFSPDKFSFEATFSQIPVNASCTADVSSTETGEGNVSFSGSGDTYTVTVLPVADGEEDPAFPNTLELILTASFSNPVLAETYPKLTLSNGQAVINGTSTAPPVITYDNTEIYPLENTDPPPIITPGDREQIITINDIPATRNIGPGTDETDWSAANPLQNSTHNYTVEMESATNNSDNTQTRWYITQTGSDVEITESETTFALTPTYDTDNNQAGAGITFYFEYDDTEASNNEYTIYFTEQHDNDCSTIREYPVTIQAPFDVDIAAVDDDCSGADEVIYDDVTAAVTEVTYTINLNNSSYKAGWQFDLELVCGELGVTLSALTGAGDVTVSGGTKGTLTNIDEKLTVPVTVTKTEGGDVSKQVTVTVKYSGTYAAAHTITASIVPPATPGSFGSYGETDVDDGIALGDDGVVEGEINQARHIIYAMPQPGAIAGVD